MILRRSRFGDEKGQATVEYIGLAVAVAVLLMGVGGGLSGHGDSIAKAMTKQLTSVIKQAAPAAK